MSNSAFGNEAPKSWIVWGRAIAVTAVPRVSQWAEIARMARGRGMSAAISCQARLVALVSSAIIGLPWPKKTTGMRLTYVTPLRL